MSDPPSSFRDPAPPPEQAGDPLSRVEELTRENEELRAQLARLGALEAQFLSNVSHELRTPLSLSIAPLEEILQRGDELHADDQRTYLATVYANQLRLLRLVDDLLDLSKLDAGKLTCSFRLLDAARAVSLYVSTLVPAAEARGMSVVFDAKTPSLPLFVDHDRFERMVMSLLSNALKFTPEGGSIHVCVAEQGGHAVISVRDTGPGIPEAAQARIFDRFSQADGSDTREHRGVGLGLSVVREYARLHGGEVSLHSVPGEGATFTLSLPTGTAHLDPSTIVAGEDARPRHPRATNLIELRVDEQEPLSFDTVQMQHSGVFSLEETGTDRRPALANEGLVLVVDDVADMRAFIGHVLGRKYRVVTAKDGADGLRKAKKLRPDVIVSEVMLPRMSGYDLCRAVKSDPALARTPIVLLSAKSDSATKLEGLSQGADDYLFKPFNASELLARVSNLVRVHRQERELLTALRALEDRDGVITQDLLQAREFQQSILPSPPQIPGIDVEVVYQPAELVGGDLYDIQVMPGGVLRLFVADATGHGVKASLTTMFIKSEYELSKRTSASPGAVLRSLNDRMARAYGHLGMRFTAVCADIHVGKGILRYASAAHPPPCVVRAGEVLELEAGGTFVGVVPDVPFQELETPLEAGDVLYLYTDGVVEQPGNLGESFGEARLYEALVAAESQGELAGNLLSMRLDEFTGDGAAPYDDITVLGVRLRAVRAREEAS